MGCARNYGGGGLDGVDEVEGFGALSAYRWLSVA